MPHTLSPGLLLAGRYQLGSALGASESATVYAAVDRVSSRECAVKVLEPALRQAPSAWSAFQELERNVAALGSGAIARASDFGVDSQLGLSFVVSERVGFPSLGEIVKTRGPVAVGVFSTVLEVLAGALDAAADKGIAHGDLKPQNLFFSTEHPTWVRVSDFGMALLRAAARPSERTVPLGWSSAERQRANAAPSRSDDIFALGLIAFYALTGRHYCRSMWELLPDAERVLAELDSSNPSARAHARSLGAELSGSFDPWFVRALAIDPSARFGSADEAARAFAALARKEAMGTLGVAAAVAAPLLFQDLPPRPPAEKAASAFVPTEPRESSDLPRSSRPPTVQAPRPKPREHVDGLPNAPPIALIAGAGAIVLVLAALGAFATWRILARPRSPSAAAGADASTSPPSSAGSAAPTPSAQLASVDSSAHFSCTPEVCEWIVCDGENVKKGVATLAMSPGRHSCSASRYGFRTAVVEFTLEPGKTTNVVFELLATKPVPQTVPRSKPHAAPAKASTKTKPAAKSKH